LDKLIRLKYLSIIFYMLDWIFGSKKEEEKKVEKKEEELGKD
jgi:hypothetical protein